MYLKTFVLIVLLSVLFDLIPGSKFVFIISMLLYFSTNGNNFLITELQHTGTAQHLFPGAK